MVKYLTQCTQGNINCLPACDVQAYITHGADEPSAQKNLLLHKVHMLIHHHIFLF